MLSRGPSTTAFIVWLVLCGVVALLSLACATEPGVALAQSIRQRTTPTGSSATSIRTSRSKASVVYEWDVEPNRTSDQYAAWLIERLSPTFAMVGRQRASIAFVNRKEGDVYRLEFRNVETDHRTAVHVTLTAMAF